MIFLSNTYNVLFVNKVNLITQTKIQSFKNVTKSFQIAERIHTRSCFWRKNSKIDLSVQLDFVCFDIMYHPPFFVCTPVFLLESFPTGCGPNSSEENALQCSILTTVLLYAEPRLDYYFPFASSEFISFAFHCTKMTPHKALNSQS